MFRDAPALRDFLRFVVEETLADPTVKLPAPVVAKGVFRRGPAFQNSADPIVRVTAMRLRKAITIYYADEGSTDDVEIVIAPGSYKPAFTFRTGQDLQSLKNQFLEKSAVYGATGSREAMCKMNELLHTALQYWPDDPEFLSEAAIVWTDRVVFGHEAPEKQFDIANTLIERACEDTDTQSPKLLFNRALHAVHTGDSSAVREHCRSMTGAASDDPLMVGLAATLQTFVTDFRDPDIDFLEPTDEAKAALPWLNFPGFLMRYDEGDYESALSAAMNMGLQEMCWGPLLRSATLAQLGLQKTAHHQLKKAVNLGPYLRNDTKRFLNYYLPSDAVVEHVFEGLEKAGLGEVS